MRLGVAGVLVLVMTVGLTTAVVLREVQAVMTERAQSGLETNLKLGRDLLRASGGAGPLHVDGEKLVASNGLVLDGTTNLVDKIREIAGGTATIFRGDLRVSTNVSQPDGTRAVGSRLAPGPVYDAVLKNGLPYRGEAEILGVPFYTAYEPLKDAAGTTIGILYVGLKKAEFISVLTDLQRQIAFTGGAMILLGGALLFFLVRQTFKPLDTLRLSMGALAAGDCDTPIPSLDRHDEIGRMAAAVQVFKDNALHAMALEQEQIEANARRASEDARVKAEAERAAAALVVQSIGAGLERLAEGDLTFRLETVLPAAYENLRGNLNSTAERLERLMGSITGQTVGLQTGTNDIARASDDLAQRTAQHAASLEQTSAALEQITTAARRTADGAKQVSDGVSGATTEAEYSGDVVRQAIDAMGRIEESSQRIGQITSVIDGIAFQTNLLALNAGVEAARAGDAGRGFAVVASEVRALAQRAAGAAKEIKSLVSVSAEQVSVGVKLVGDTGQALERITQQIGAITGIVDAIAAAAREQAGGLAEVSTAISLMDQVTQENAAMVEESTATTRHLADATGELVRLASQFSLSQPAAQEDTQRPVPIKRREPAVRANGKCEIALTGSRALPDYADAGLPAATRRDTMSRAAASAASSAGRR